MKTIFTLLLCFFTVSLFGQWSNTNNAFYDSLLMRVNNNTTDQTSPVVLRSYPDSGWIVFWTDARAGYNTSHIYAQKLDKNGNAVWQDNGVPVATGNDYQSFSNYGNADYRNYAHACSDSAGGFYMAWQDITINGVCVQHVRSDGSAVYGPAGFPAFQYTSTTPAAYGLSQLIPDGKKGFYLGVLQTYNLGPQNFLLSAWREENNNPVSYFYKRMDPDVTQGDYGTTACVGNHNYYLDFSDDRVSEFYIYPDTYGGCGAVWLFSRNGAAPTGGLFLAYNHIIRARSNATSTAYRRVDDIAQTKPVVKNYQKDSLYALFNFSAFTWTTFCGGGPTAVSVTQTKIENGGEGYQQWEDQIYSPALNDIYFPRGGVLQTPVQSNIIAQMAVVNERYNSGPTFTKGFFLPPVEKFDSIPYQLATDTAFAYRAYNSDYPVSLKKINLGRDSVLDGGTGYGSYQHDVTFASGGNRAFVGASINNATYNNAGLTHLLQEVRVDCTADPDSFSIHLNTASKKGVVIGKDINTGAQISSINYDYPHVAMDAKGDAVLFTYRAGNAVRVSPVGDSAKLLWEAAGKPIGNNTSPSVPLLAIDGDGTGVVVWQAATPGFVQGVYTRHIDSLATYFNACNGHYYLYKTPGVKKVRPLPPPGYSNFSTSTNYTMLGSTGQWVNFDMATGNSYTTVVQVQDNYNFGYAYAQAYDHIYGMRYYNGKPYLDRNYQITPAANPSGANIGVRLYFTTEQFNVLKAADPLISSPANLVVIKQPSSGDVPTSYAPVASEQILYPVAWGAVDGGYYVQVNVSGFSNFFIQQGAGILPVKWISVNAEWSGTATAKVSWSVAEQTGVKEYVVQQSNDAVSFVDACRTDLVGNANYSCNALGVPDKTNYYRVMEKDIDGKISLSKTVALHAAMLNGYTSLYPNPAHSEVTVESNEIISSLRIFDTHGRGLLQLSPAAKKTTLSVKQWPAGMYILQTQTASGKTAEQKLFVQ